MDVNTIKIILVAIVILGVTLTLFKNDNFEVIIIAIAIAGIAAVWSTRETFSMEGV